MPSCSVRAACLNHLTRRKRIVDSNEAVPPSSSQCVYGSMLYNSNDCTRIQFDGLLDFYLRSLLHSLFQGGLEPFFSPTRKK